MSFKTDEEVERKILTILKILGNHKEPMGSRMLARYLKEHGFELSERAIRYHLKLTDERGLTKLVRNRDGRVITEKGLQETGKALVKDKVGYAISRIESLAFFTEFNLKKKQGLVPVNISIFKKDQFPEACRKMYPAFEKGFCVSNLVYLAREEERLGNLVVPKGHVALATVCSIVVNGTLLKAGIPMDSRFGGMLQIKNGQPVRFTELIHYDGCSLDPSEIFIKAGMTSVQEAVLYGNGEILANYREIPAACRPVAEEVIERLKEARLNGILVFGKVSEDVCEINVSQNKIGIILIGGLNPIAMAKEMGIPSENYSMNTVIDYSRLININNIIS